MKEDLRAILTTLNEIQVKGATNIGYMLGVMQKVQELIELCGENND
jgi:hypothetical protein